MAEECQLFRPPNIVFDRNTFTATDKHGRVTLTYNAKEAMRFMNYEARQKFYSPAEAQGQPNTISYLPPKLEVQHAQHWKHLDKPKDIEITEVKEVSDSFFLSTFKGYLEGAVKVEKVKEAVIPLEKLGPTNPITFYHQGSMYEDELDDNGLIQYEYKFRTMATCWFALIRNYARIDNVTLIIYDTRIYWEAGWSKIARQFMVRQVSWDALKEKEGELPQGWRMNPNQSHLVYPFLKEEFVENEYIHFG
jgi:hypothetical protein